LIWRIPGVSQHGDDAFAAGHRLDIDLVQGEVDRRLIEISFGT